jgi:hypothetical protein
MSDIYTAQHTENAIDLYELRLSWLTETDISVNEFTSVEARLNASLYDATPVPTIARQHGDAAQAKPQKEPTHPKEPTKEAECFVYLASRINAADLDTVHAAYELAYQWLALEAGKAAAAEAVFSLYPEADHSKLLKLYDEHEPLRPTLFRIFRKQMLTLPLAMVSAAAHPDNATPALTVEALHYAAAHPDLGLDLFRTHYVPLLSGRTQFEASIIEAALWGGLVRSDPDAITALGAALNHTDAATERANLLRLAALTGQSDFLPLLLSAAESDPDTGYPLLVLYGQKNVMPALLSALETAHTIEQAATAFNLITDQILPRIPRLTVVGEETDDDDEGEPAQIPDIKAAHTWWQHNQARWKTDERWLFGKSATSAHLIALSKKHAGQFGCDLLALMALSQKAPLNIPWEIWRARQQHLLAAHAQTPPAAKAGSQATTKAMSARHA